MVPADDEGVAVEDGRAAFAVGVVGPHAAEFLLPEDFAFEVEAVKAAGAKEGVEALAVGGWGI